MFPVLVQHGRVHFEPGARRRVVTQEEGTAFEDLHADHGAGFGEVEEVVGPVDESFEAAGELEGNRSGPRSRVTSA
jgi:hypothetical protein